MTSHLAAAVLILAGLARAAAAADCSENFPVGQFGVPQDDPVVMSGALAVDQFVPVFVAKSAFEAEGVDCQYVYAVDVFRLVYEPRPDVLLAGCHGDFDGDRRRDYALLMRRASNDTVQATVFLSRPGGYRIVALGDIIDPYGFGRDRSVWPGPFCATRPDGGIFSSPVGGEQAVVGDLITVGWQSYFWRAESNDFGALLTSD